MNVVTSDWDLLVMQADSETMGNVKSALEKCLAKQKKSIRYRIGWLIGDAEVIDNSTNIKFLKELIEGRTWKQPQIFGEGLWSRLIDSVAYSLYDEDSTEMYFRWKRELMSPIYAKLESKAELQRIKQINYESHKKLVRRTKHVAAANY
ncbi:hypothetical protein WJM93_14305 [Lactiplantibacillus plantarum]|uniref:hypothetical protein n=1 Tax=Lactiplantibacillus plantarum TaxID=1590 RepID=UPI003097D498